MKVTTKKKSTPKRNRRQPIPCLLCGKTVYVTFRHMSIMPLHMGCFEKFEKNEAELRPQVMLYRAYLIEAGLWPGRVDRPELEDDWRTWELLEAHEELRICDKRDSLRKKELS